jgi:hypothetical protein
LPWKKGSTAAYTCMCGSDARVYPASAGKHAMDQRETLRLHEVTVPGLSKQKICILNTCFPRHRSKKNVMFDITQTLLIGAYNLRGYQSGA